MNVTLQSTEIINNLKNSAESVTGESYENLTEAIQALIDGYGSSSEGGSCDSADFVGIKYSGFKGANEGDPTLPTIADARSLDGHNMRPERMVYGMFWNMNSNLDGGMNAYLKKVYMPSEPTHLTTTFSQCGALEVIHGNFENVVSITTAFDGCKSLKEAPYMPNLTTIGANTFRNCTSLTSIKFYKKANTFHASVFTGCINLTDIYVPWAEGEVANAPWGAPNENLIIHYNTVYDENHNPITE